jgi:hypothetical protein
MACVAACITACGKDLPPPEQTHVVILSIAGRTDGEERAISRMDGQRETVRTRTRFDGATPTVLEGELTIERGRPISLRVTGDAPASLNATVDVTITPDRTDTFPIVSPLPAHVLSALVRHSIVRSRRRFIALPEGTLTVAPCRDGTAPFTDATCHEVRGLASGPVLVWLDARLQLAAAVAATPAGPLVAATADRHTLAPALLRRFDVYYAR